MLNSGSLLALLAVALVAVDVSASEIKPASCCTKVTNKEIKEPILGYLVQRARHPCVNAVIFQTQSGLFCSYVRAPWVRQKIVEFEKTKARSTIPPVVSTSPVSLLSIITSTASPPFSSTALPSSSSTSQIPPSSSSSTSQIPPSSSTALPSSSSTSQIPPSSSTALPSSSSTSQIPPSSSTALPSSSSTSQMSPGETFSESRNEQAEV